MTQLLTKRRVLSLIVVMAIIFSCVPISAAETDVLTHDDETITVQNEGEVATGGVTLSEEETGADDDIPSESPLIYSIVGFADLADEVKNQSVAVDTALEALILPDTLTATILEDEVKTEVAIAVTWQSDPEYAAITVGALEVVPAGTYVFTPELPKGYALADGVSLPVITVEVEPMGIVAAADDTWDGGTKGAQTISGGTITVTGTVAVTGTLTITGNVTFTGSGTLLRDANYLEDLISVSSEATLTLDGVTIDGGGSGVYDVTGSLVNVELDGIFNMKSGNLSNNVITQLSTDGKSRAAVCNSGTFTMTGGTISHNSAVSNGAGGVCNYETFTMTGGTISDNKAYFGGGVANSSTFTMTGGTILNNTAERGGGVINDGIFTMTGGTISGNKATDSAYGSYGGGVLNTSMPPIQYSTFNISGSPKIENNIVGSGNQPNTGGVFFAIGTQFSITGPLTSGASIGVERVEITDPVTVVATGAAASDLSHFYISNATGKLGTHTGFTYNIADNEIVLGTVQQTYVKSDGSDATGDGTRLKPFATIGRAYTEITTTGEIIVMDTVIASTPISLSGAKTVTLKSDVLTGSTQMLKRWTANDLITIKSGVTLTLQNLIIDGDKESVDNARGSLVRVEPGGTFIMNGGKLSGNKVTGGFLGGKAIGGSGVFNEGTFILNDGKISENIITNGGDGVGGGVYNASSFTMNGGEISGNNATGNSSGGGVLNVGTFEMASGEISGNNGTSNSSGGGVLNEGTFEMTSGKISENKGTGSRSGGGVLNNGIFEMIDGNLSYNTADGGELVYGGGGGVRNNGTFIMTNGKILNNSSIRGGGGVFNFEIFTMNGGEISGNTTDGRGGGVCSFTGTFTMNGGVISSNTAGTGGGVLNGGKYGIEGNVGGTLTINGGIVSGNTAVSGPGGGVYNSSTFNISGLTKIENNITGSGNLPGTGGAYIVLNEPEGPEPITIGALTSGSRIGIEGLSRNIVGTVVATNAIASDVQYLDIFYISNATGKIGVSTGFEKNGTNIVLASPDVKTVVVGAQTGTLTAGMAGSVTYSVITTNIASNSPITLNNAPTGVTLATTTTAGNSTTVTISTTAAVSAGTYPLSLTIDGTTSNSFDLVVGAVPTYTVTVNNGTGSGSFAASTVVVITANSAPYGYRFDKWTTNDGVLFTHQDAMITDFTMPSKNVTVTATYEAVLATGEIIGTVTDSDGVLLSGVTVSVMSGSTLITTATTIADGAFLFTDLPYGVYSLVATYSPNGIPITVTKSVELNLQSITQHIQMPSDTPSLPSPPDPSSPSVNNTTSSSKTKTDTLLPYSYWIEVPEAKTLSQAAHNNKLNYARSHRATITGIRKDSLQLIAKEGLVYKHDTIANNAVQVRVYVNEPENAVKDILVSAYVTGSEVERTHRKFEKYFDPDIRVISLEQQGDFGIKVQIAALVDLSGMETGNLYFYSYDKQTNKYNRIKTEYKIDSKGYLHFATFLAGDIIVSSGPLKGEIYEDATESQEAPNPTTGGDDSAPTEQSGTHNPSMGGDYALSAYADDLLKLDNLAASMQSSAPESDTNNRKIRIVSILYFAIMLFGLSIMLLSASTLWVVIPRKNNPTITPHPPTTP